jgi:hypothetical protein
MASGRRAAAYRLIGFGGRAQFMQLTRTLRRDKGTLLESRGGSRTFRKLARVWKQSRREARAIRSSSTYCEPEHPR